MGMKRPPRRVGLADALFGRVQQRVLALLFAQPDRRFQSAELIRLAKGGTGARHRQPARLAAAGLVTVTRSGHQKHYQARRHAPVFAELHGLVVKTVAVVEPLRRALAPHLPAIAAAAEVALVIVAVAQFMTPPDSTGIPLSQSTDAPHGETSNRTK